MKTFLPILFCLGCLVSANATTYDFAYASPDTKKGLLGYEVADHYDVTLYVPGECITIANGKLTSVSAVVVDNENITDFKMWASVDLYEPAQGMVVTGDIFNAEPEIEAIDGTNYKRITCHLDEPFTVGEKGLYVGYSFEVKKLDGTNQTLYPVAVYEQTNGGNAMIARTANNYPNFMEIKDVSLACTATFEGDFLEDAVRVTVDPVFVAQGKQFALTGSVINQGINEVSSVEYVYTIGEKEYTGSLKTDLKGYPTYSQTFSINAEAIPAVGEYDGKFTITKVNGVDNQAASNYTLFKANVLEALVIHRPVMEEFTGTWCQWCTRGMAGVEKIKDEVADAIVIAYHQRDIMALDADVVPECAMGLPSALIDRVVTVDPFFGSNLSNPQPGAVVNDVKAQAEVAAPADIDVVAEWIDDDSAIRLTSNTIFPVVPSDGYNYRVAYVLLEDGLHGEGSDWYQNNGYANYQGKEDPYLSKYYYAPALITDMKYNDVAIYSTGVRGISGSLPKTNTLEAGTAYEHVYEVALEDLVTKDGKQSYQNLRNLKVVVLLLKQDTAQGTIVNANIAEVPMPSAIDTVEADQAPVRVEYFDLTGRKVAAPANGIFVKRATMADGQVKASKVLLH